MFFSTGVPLTNELAIQLLDEGNDSEIESLADGDDLYESIGVPDYQEDGESNDEMEDALFSEEPIPSTSTNDNSQCAGKRKRNVKVWNEASFNQKTHNYPNDQPKSVRSAMEYFQDYLNDEFFEEAAECSNNYHMRKTGYLLNTNSVELKKFVGVHLIMGCIPYPRIHMYWRQDMQLEMVTKHITRDRFKMLRSAFHVINTDTAPEGNENILWKVQPIITRIKKACDKIERQPSFYSIDEQMIPFCGICPRGLRQVVRNKPRPQGLKLFVATTSTGLMIDFEVYQGAKTQFEDKSLGIGAAVILHLSKSIPPGSCIYFDRYFSSIPLIERLSEMGKHGTATLMQNRLAERKNIPFKKDRCMSRGESQQFVSDDTVVVKWMDNKAVLMVSNCTSADEIVKVKRWDKKMKSYIDVTMPKVIDNYNKNMGGVDVLDQSMEYYRTFIKTRKWTLKVILHFIDLSIVNAWRLYRIEATANKVPKNKLKDLLEFRLEIADSLVGAPDRKRIPFIENENVNPNVNFERYRPAHKPSEARRYDGYEHYPIFDEIDSPRTCRLENCKSRSKIRCEKCNVYLCLSRNKFCFKNYHKK